MQKIEALRAFFYELVAKLAPQLLPRTEPEPPVRLEETLGCGNYVPQAVKGGTVVDAVPGYREQYRARMEAQEAEARHQALVRRGQEALALAALEAAQAN